MIKSFLSQLRFDGNEIERGYTSSNMRIICLWPRGFQKADLVVKDSSKIVSMIDPILEL